MLRKLWGSFSLSSDEVRIMRNYPVEVFTSFFQTIDNNLIQLFKSLGMPKRIFLTEDDQILNWRSQAGLFDQLGAKVVVAAKGGHNSKPSYQKEAAKLWQKK